MLDWTFSHHISFFTACIGADHFIDTIFNQLTEMGAQMRKLISEAMIDTSAYSSLAHGQSFFS